MTSPFNPIEFTRGPAWSNRLMLAPLTNSQSHDDGTLSDDEYRWLTMRASGGFGMTMTCASHVQQAGRGFPGQLGCFSDNHLDGLARLATGIREAGSVSSLQLHHAGMRSPKALIGEAPHCPSDNEEFGARALTNDEVHGLVEDFVNAAVRAEQAGFDGVEIHGAHGYIVCQFLSAEINQRSDEFGGSLENRARLLMNIIDGIRERCGQDFQLGVRLSPERFGIVVGEARDLACELFRLGKLDYLDMSLWDVFKAPAQDGYEGQSLLSLFTSLDRGDCRLGVAGQLRQPADVERSLAEGADFGIVGRAAILQHNFPALAKQGAWEPVELPVSRAYLAREGLGESFINYMAGWPGFVAES